MYKGSGILRGDDIETLTNNAYGRVAQNQQVTVLWIGYFVPRESGPYSFRTTSDDGSYLWLNETPSTNIALMGHGGIAREIKIDEVWVANGFNHGMQMRESTNPKTLTAGNVYPIMFVMGNSGGGYGMKVEYRVGNGGWSSDFNERWYSHPNSIQLM